MADQQEIKTRWIELKIKCDFYFSRIISYPLSSPEHVYFTITERCNLKCKMCNIPSLSKQEKEELNSKECKDLINQVSYFKINHLIFSGGEPLLRKDIFDLIKYARNKNINMVDIITNGILIDEKEAKNLLDAGVTHVTISVDGIGKVNDLIRGEGSFQKAMRAVDFINKYRNNGVPTLGFNFTIMDCNIDQILPMIELARSKGCHIIVFQPLLCDNVDMQKRGNDELWVSKDNIPRLKEIMNKVIELKSEMSDLLVHVDDKILEMIPSYFAGTPLHKTLKCYEGIVRIVICDNGDVWACGGKYGNIREQSLRDCWISPEARKIRQEVKRCSNHCLQSCIHLNGLSNVYSDVMEFIATLERRNEGREYLLKTVALLEEYGFLLTKRLVKHLRSAHKNGNDNYISELKTEVARTSEIIKKLT